MLKFSLVVVVRGHRRAIDVAARRSQSAARETPPLLQKALARSENFFWSTVAPRLATTEEAEGARLSRELQLDSRQRRIRRSAKGAPEPSLGADALAPLTEERVRYTPSYLGIVG